MTSPEYNRIRYLQRYLQDNDINGAVLSYSRDIFYYTGTAQPSFLVITPDDFVLYVKNGYEFAVREAFIDADKISPERNPELVFGHILSNAVSGRIATELDILTANQFLEYQRIFRKFEIIDISPAILEQRKTKDAEEIRRIEKACQVIHSGHLALCEISLVGKTELEIAALVENAHRRAGHEGNIFIRVPDFIMSRGPISSGSNLSQFSGVVYSVTGVGLSASVPAGPSRRTIQKGDPVMVDIPVCVNGYHADQTRTYFAGTAPQQLQDLFFTLRDVEDELIDRIRPGMTGSDIYQMACNIAERQQIGDSFLSFGKGIKSKLAGHGVGLEVNEPPVLSASNQSQIQENFVLAVELHLMKEGAGVVKLEDTILVGRTNNRRLTISPRSLIEL